MQTEAQPTKPAAISPEDQNVLESAYQTVMALFTAVNAANKIYGEIGAAILADKLDPNAAAGALKQIRQDAIQALQRIEAGVLIPHAKGRAH